MQKSVSSQEFTEYLAYFSVEPWPEERADVRSATIAALLANSVPRKDRKVSQVNDFLPEYWKESIPPVQQSVERMRAEMMLIGKVFETKKAEGATHG